MRAGNHPPRNQTHRRTSLPARKTYFKASSRPAVIVTAAFFIFMGLGFLTALLLVSGIINTPGVVKANNESLFGSQPAMPMYAISNELQFPAVAVSTPLVPDPPVSNQGGVCIEGSIIDVYDQPRGAGWTVSITPKDSANSGTISGPADANGNFILPQKTGAAALGAGTYTVSLEIPQGWRPFTPSSFEVTLNGNPASGCAHVRFKTEALGCLVVTKQDHVDKAGIPGWVITASLGTDIRNDSTSGQGIVLFRNLAPGTWTVEEETRVGWKPSEGFTNRVGVNITSPRNPNECQGLTFENEQVPDGCIVVSKKDNQGNPLAGWAITLINKAGLQPNQSGVTGQDGQYWFQHLPLGDWVVTEVLQPGWRMVSGNLQVVSLTQPGTSCMPATIVNEPLGCIDGTKINQLDQPMSGWTIKAHNPATGENFSQVTGKDGYFLFDTLGFGTWELSEDMQPGWSPVTPAQFTVGVGQQGNQDHSTCSHVRFKNKTDYACVDIWKLDDKDGSGLPGWPITLQPAYGGGAISQATDGTGWTRFNQLAPGVYLIKEAMLAGWTPAGQTTWQGQVDATGQCQEVVFRNRQHTDASPAGQSAPVPTPIPKPMQIPAYGVPPACSRFYIVQAGDTLNYLASAFGVSDQALMSANNLSDPSQLVANMQLCIP